MLAASDNPLMIDDRTGSGDLLPLLKARHVPVTLCRMEFGDAAFFGSGPDGCPIPIGIEIKQTSDVLACITDGRFAGHQLPGLVTTYEYSILLIEGSYRSDPRSGTLQIMRRGTWTDARIGQRGFMHRELEQWLFTMQFKGGLRVAHTFNRDETVGYLINLYNWWTSKDWAAHRSHLAPNNSHQPDAALLVRPTLVRLVAKELPGIGWERAGEVAKYFKTVLDMAVAEEADWMDIKGIGKETAAKAVRAIKNGGRI